MKTETGYAADLQAIADQIDRRDREIASLKEQLIERLAEIDGKDRRIDSLESELAAFKEDSTEMDSKYCWHCAHPDSGEPERHVHEPKGGHWHHYIDPGDGLADNCKNSDLLERIFQASEERIAELEGQLATALREREGR